MPGPWEKYGGTATAEEEGPWKKFRASPSIPAPVVAGSPPAGPGPVDEDEAPERAEAAPAPAERKGEGFARGDAKYANFQPGDAKDGMQAKDLANFAVDQQLSVIGRERAAERGEPFDPVTSPGAVLPAVEGVGHFVPDLVGKIAATAGSAVSSVAGAVGAVEKEGQQRQPPRVAEPMVSLPLQAVRWLYEQDEVPRWLRDGLRNLEAGSDWVWQDVRDNLYRLRKAASGPSAKEQGRLAVEEKVKRSRTK